MDSMRDGQAWAENIRQRMAQLNPNVAKSFSLKDVAASLAPLRLLFTRDAAVANNPLLPVSSYMIVSYCWRHKDWTKVGDGPIREPWPIQQAFVNELLAMRQSADEGIWIDQPCIDQDNEEEKKMAVGVMDIIYRSARQLIIILEDVKVPDEEEEMANRYFDLKRRGHLSQDWDISEKDLELMKSLLERILSARWFSRAWCSHGFRISQYCLSDPMTQARFRAMSTRGTIVRILSGLLADFYLRVCKWGDGNIKNFNLFRQYFTPSTIQSKDMTTDVAFRGQWSLIQQLHDTVALECSHKNDRMQIALNLSGLPLFWMGHAETDDEVWWIFTILALAAGEASVLAFRGPLLELHQGKEMTFSWARRSYDSKAECDISVKEEDVRITSAKPDYLELDLLFLEKAAKRPSITAIDLAEKILHGHKLYDRDTPVRGPLILSLWRECVRDSLACFIDGGYEWMKVGGNLLYEEFCKYFAGWPNIDGAGEHSNLSSAARELLSFQHIEDSVPAFAEKYLNPTITFLAVISDRRFFGCFGWGEMRIETSPSGGQALIRTFLPGQKLAVPAALANLQ